MGSKQFAELDWRESNLPIDKALLPKTHRCRPAILFDWGGSQITRTAQWSRWNLSAYQ